MPLFSERSHLRAVLVERDDCLADAVRRRLLRLRRYTISRVAPDAVVEGRFDPSEVDVVILGVDGGSSGLAPLRWLTRHAPTTAVVALHHGHDVDAGIEVVVTGAQDVLPFQEATAARLDRVIRAAIARKRIEVVALSSAMTDPVTGMASRGWMLQRLELAVCHAASCAEGWQVAVLFCDLDRFKAVNDALGHARGDELLRLVAERLRSVVRAEDPVTRFGGDEFVILLEGHNIEGLAQRIALRALGALAAPFEVDGHAVSVYASIGLALHRRGETTAALLRNADLALYRAKENGRNRVEVFDDELRAGAERQEALASQLALDLRGGRLEMSAVPLWRLSGGTVEGVVISPTWEHCDDSDSLIGLALRHGLGPELGRWIISRAIEEVSRREPGTSVVVAVPPGVVAQPAFVGWVADALAGCEVDPARLVIAIGESELAEPDLIQPALDGLDELGVAVALADFGAGTSSLALFGSVYVDEVLLASELVAGIAEDGPRRAVVESLLRIADAIGQRVVATGPATVADVEALAAIGCDFVATRLDASLVPPRREVVVPPVAYPESLAVL